LQLLAIDVDLANTRLICHDWMQLVGSQLVRFCCQTLSMFPPMNPNNSCPASVIFLHHEIARTYLKELMATFAGLSLKQITAYSKFFQEKFQLIVYRTSKNAVKLVQCVILQAISLWM